MVMGVCGCCGHDVYQEAEEIVWVGGCSIQNSTVEAICVLLTLPLSCQQSCWSATGIKHSLQEPREDISDVCNQKKITQQNGRH